MMNIFNWISTRRKLTLAIIAGIFLFIFLIFIISQTVKNRFFPSNQNNQTPPTRTEDSSSPATLEIQIPKQSYSLKEKIPVSVVANSNGQAVRAFDILVEYDPGILVLTYKQPPELTDFLYFVKNTGTLLRVSGVQKPDSNSDQVFNNTVLTKFQFTPIKAGKSTIKLIYSPNLMNESNLLSKTSEDLLTRAIGAEIEIK